MQAVYINSQIPEQEAKRRYKFPENLMMENAAAALESKVYEAARKTDKSDTYKETKVLIVCGSGNNGGDGLALSRRLSAALPLEVYLVSQPKTSEAQLQHQMALAAGITFLQEFPQNLNQYSIIVDCILGTGFSGELRPNIAQIIEKLNKTDSIKIACDVPTAFAFKADYTVTMGALKLCLFTDTARNFCGEITTANLGISSTKFKECAQPDAYLIQKQDIRLPFRTNKAAHKGNFGHTAVFAGEKSGAGIIAATAALNFGSGLVTLVKTENSNLEQFKINPELMINNQIPANTSCVLIGCGLGLPSEITINQFENWFYSAKNPACVLDADLFNYKALPSLLDRLNQVQDCKIILTPHPKELKTLYEMLFPDEQKLSISQICDSRLSIGKKITEKYKHVTVIMKSAVTCIAEAKNDGGRYFVCASGAQSLAKSGSGDVLAGLTASLLAQNYSSTDTAITAAYIHGAAGKTFFNGEDFSLTPQKLIDSLKNFN